MDQPVVVELLYRPILVRARDVFQEVKIVSFGAWYGKKG